MQQETKRTVQIKLRPTPEQADEIEKLFLAFKIGLNFCLDEIEKAYQKTAGKYTRVNEAVKGECAGCHKEKTLAYRSDDKTYCISCVMRNYSEYTVRSLIIGTKDRKVEPDLKNAVSLENQTHFHMMFSQAYANWKSFDAWRKKREYERDTLKKELSDLEKKKETRDAVTAANLIWKNARLICETDQKITRRNAMARASQDIYKLFPHVLPRDISRNVNKLRRLNSLSRPVRFPRYDSVQAIQMHNNFVKFEKGKLHMSLFYKKKNQQVTDFYGNKYLNQFLSDMEEDNEVYTNLIKRIDNKKTSYYLMYPLTVKREIPAIFDLTDVFTVCFSPDRVLVHCRHNEVNGNGSGESYKWYKLGWIVDKKTHCSEKRRELQEHHTRNSLRRIKKMGNAEQRATRTFNHQLSHNIIEYILGYLFSIEDGENVLNQGRIPDGIWTKFQTEGILFSGKETVTKEAENEWVIESEEKKYIIRKEQTDMLNVYAPRSDNPLIVMWDLSTGITADYGWKLNSVKRVWPVVQQQEFIKHKAILRCVPVKMFPYREDNDLVCSFCGKTILKKDELGKSTKDPVKTITTMLRRVKNLKCDKCGHELNLLLNQARNLSKLPLTEKKEV